MRAAGETNLPYINVHCCRTIVRLDHMQSWLQRLDCILDIDDGGVQGHVCIPRTSLLAVRHCDQAGNSYQVQDQHYDRVQS